MIKISDDDGDDDPLLHLALHLSKNENLEEGTSCDSVEPCASVEMEISSSPL